MRGDTAYRLIADDDIRSLTCAATFMALVISFRWHNNRGHGLAMRDSISLADFLAMSISGLSRHMIDGAMMMGPVRHACCRNLRRWLASH